MKRLLLITVALLLLMSPSLLPAWAAADDGIDPECKKLLTAAELAYIGEVTKCTADARGAIQNMTALAGEGVIDSPDRLKAFHAEVVKLSAACNALCGLKAPEAFTKVAALTPYLCQKANSAQEIMANVASLTDRLEISIGLVKVASSVGGIPQQLDRVDTVLAERVKEHCKWRQKTKGAMEEALGECFIATAAYSTPTAQEIDTLRQFRDAFLLNHFWGRQFVLAYYRLSPPIAAFIREHKLVRTIVRELFVDPLVSLAAFTRDAWHGRCISP